MFKLLYYDKRIIIKSRVYQTSIENIFSYLRHRDRPDWRTRKKPENNALT